MHHKPTRSEGLQPFLVSNRIGTFQRIRPSAAEIYNPISFTNPFPYGEDQIITLLLYFNLRDA